jgi:AI-2 transport protein TqsA
VQPLVVVVCLVIILAAIKAAAAVVVPFLLATMLAVAFQPLSDWLTKRGLPTALSAILTIVGVLSIIGGASWIMYQAAADFFATLPKYQEQLVAWQQEFSAWLSSKGMTQAAQNVASADPTDAAVAMAGDGVSLATTFVETLFLVLIITAFIQLEATTYRTKLLRVFGTSRPLRTSLAALHDVQRYMRVKVVLAAVGGTFLGIWCWLWGVESPLLWGVLAFALNFIPVIGSIISSIPPILLALAERGLPTAMGVAAGYLFVNLVIDNMLEPRIMGRTLGLSPLAVLLAMLIWGFVLGPVGAILAVPLTMTVKVALEKHPDLRGIAMLIGDVDDLDKPKPVVSAPPTGPPIPMPPATTKEISAAHPAPPPTPVTR